MSSNPITALANYRAMVAVLAHDFNRTLDALRRKFGLPRDVFDTEIALRIPEPGREIFLKYMFRISDNQMPNRTTANWLDEWHPERQTMSSGARPDRIPEQLVFRIPSYFTPLGAQCGKRADLSAIVGRSKLTIVVDAGEITTLEARYNALICCVMPNNARIYTSIRLYTPDYIGFTIDDGPAHILESRYFAKLTHI